MTFYTSAYQGKDAKYNLKLRMNLETGHLEYAEGDFIFKIDNNGHLRYKVKLYD